MRIILDSVEVGKAFQSFMRHLTKGCVATTGTVSWKGVWQESDIHWNSKFRFWVAEKTTSNRHWLQFGLHDPSEGGRLESACEMSFPVSGFDGRMNGFFVGFGKDVLVAHSGRVGKRDMHFPQFLELHGYDLATHEVRTPEGKEQLAVILSGISSPALAYNAFRFVSAVSDHRQWHEQGLLPGGNDKIVFGPKAAAPDESCPDPGFVHGGLHQRVARGVREQLARYVESRKLRVRIGSAPGSDMVLVSPDNAVLAALQVKTRLSPADLYAGVGQLLLSRHTLRAAKFLVVPGALGPFFTQTLFRHDIHVVSYKLTQDMDVVLDPQDIFAAIQNAGQ
ncbi:hypothetical protein [Fundidesulfovibrio terrae]|uniref:hypothetical protein n=1 Tax=Fundidesulfovibrio terrae TaxID=2922866 RepID=UPI001FAFA17D|nr:hypothetical protein [Fundidesulfovibrio terrae]